MKRHLILSVICILMLCFAACNEKKTDTKLPILGRRQMVDNDTVYHQVANFSFLDQDSTWVTNDTFKNTIYVADFFFTSCPTICPIMDAQMLRVYDKFENDPMVKLLSHTIDPEHDSVAVLREFANRLGVESKKWHFVTGEKEDIYKLGQTSYMVSADEDSGQPGGYIHSGAFILVDEDRHIRGVYDGTKPDQVDRLMNDIGKLKNEYKE